MCLWVIFEHVHTYGPVHTSGRNAVEQIMMQAEQEAAIYSAKHNRQEQIA